MNNGFGSDLVMQASRDEAKDRLREKAQNEATCFALNDMLKDVQAEVRRLREENERLRKDAERYRWLKDCNSGSIGITTINTDSDFEYILVGNDADDAIDAARGEK